MTPSLRRALIIDDEPPARDDLRRLLARHAHVSIAGEAGTLEEARRALAAGDYDLVFLDVQLRGGSGFDLVPGVRPRARIIFVTGHDRYALRAFEVNALDYLLKPVAPERLGESLRRFETGPGSRPPMPAPSGVGPLRLEDATFLKTDTDAARFVTVRDIAVIFSAENYSELRLTDGSHHLVRRTMKAWEEQLPAHHFMRVHRTALVNLHTIARSAHHDRETTHLFLAPPAHRQPVRARRELWPEIERRLSTLKR